MEFRILGPLAVVDDEGLEVPLRGARVRRLLALLVVHAGEVVPADRIVEELWGDDQPVTAAGALQTQVSRLRTTLGGPAGGPHIETRSPGYVLVAASGDIDAGRFEAAVREGRDLLAGGEAERASSVLRSALSLWRGEVLTDLGDAPFAEAERSRLAELRRAALEDRIDADLACGRHAELVAELDAMVAAEPLRERRTGQLMLALYRSGRQADALRVYQDTRRYLAEELGIEPSPDLRKLESRVLDQDPGLDVARREPAVATRPPTRRVAAPLSPLVGRTAELASVEGLIADHRLVTLVGPGGAGKTRLAVETAVHLGPGFEDGAAMAELAAVEDPATVVPAVVRALGLDEIRGADPTSALAVVLEDLELLLVLDNCEHVLDDAARFAAEILGRCPRLSVLATSRQDLGVPGEARFLVPPLDPDAATTLFAERAAAASGTFRLDDASRPAVESICERLDGIPLAIELAASRLRVLSASQLAERLHDRFRVLTGGSRAALPRQQTLRAMVDWSYDLLDDEERHVFERLSVFAGSCSLAAAEAVAAGYGVDGADVAAILERLIEKSLVMATAGRDSVRFGMLQTLTEYGRDRLAEHGEADHVRRRLAEWLRDVARWGATAPNEDGQLTFALDLGPELDTIRQTIAWALEHDPTLAVEIATFLGWFWPFNDAVVDGYRALAQGLAAEPELSDEVRTRAHAWAGWLASAAGDLERGAAWGDEAVRSARALRDPLLIGRTGLLRAVWMIDQGQLAEAEPLLAEVRRVLQEAGDDFGLAYLDLREGIAASFRGAAARAYWLSLRAVRRFRRLGDEGLLILALQRFGECADVCGYVDEAATALEEAVARNEGLPGIARKSSLVSRLARVRVNQGRLADALELAEEGVTLARLQTWGLHTGMALQARGRVFDALGRRDDAAADLTAAISAFEGAGIHAMADGVRRQLEDLRADAPV